LKWTERFSTVHQFDVLGTNNETDPVAPGGDFATDGVAGDSTAMINYAFYTLTDRVKVGMRQEWWKADGTSYNTLTGGLNLQVTPNMMVRPEVRYLWAPGVQGGPPGSVADNIARIFSNEAVFGVDATWTF
jgi:hypothetical protein